MTRRPPPKAKLMRSALDAACLARADQQTDAGPPAFPVNGSAVLLLLALATDAWPHDDGDGWACRASSRELANRCGLARSTVQRAARALADAGLVRRYGEGCGGSGSCLYVLTPSAVLEPSDTETDADRRSSDVWPDREPTEHGHGGPTGGPILGPGWARHRATVGASPGRVLDEVQDLQDSDTSSRAEGTDAADPGSTDAPPAGAGGDLVARASRQAQATRLLRDRPSWCPGPWLDRRTVDRLAALPTSTADAVRVALAETRERADRLANPAGYLIRWLEDPDADAVEAWRDKRERTRARREARAEREEAMRAEAERRTELAIAGQMGCLERVDDEFGPAETAARIAHYVRHLDNRVVRDLLAGRSEAERRAYLAKTGRAGEAVLGEPWASGAVALERAHAEPEPGRSGPRPTCPGCGGLCDVECPTGPGVRLVPCPDCDGRGVAP